MMAESAKAPFDSPDWIFEIKLDGYRAITSSADE
jgi:bifunctional non-homologous end joining protein LigD